MNITMLRVMSAGSIAQIYSSIPQSPRNSSAKIVVLFVSMDVMELFFNVINVQEAIIEWLLLMPLFLIYVFVQADILMTELTFANIVLIACLDAWPVIQLTIAITVEPLWAI